MSLICPHLYAPCLCVSRLHQVGASGPRKFSTTLSEALALSLLALVGGHMDLNANAHREESRRVTKGHERWRSSAFDARFERLFRW
jgi:hypothetical protein